MTIDKAIDTLQEILADVDSQWETAGQESLKLGIEALKAVQKFQKMGSKIHPLRLPGETVN